MLEKNDRTMNIGADDLISVPMIHLNLDDLAEDACYETRQGGNYCVVHCTPRSRRGQACPSCGSQELTVHGYLKEDRYVHDVNIGVMQIDLLVKVPRYRCLECGSTFSHRFDSILENRQMTKRLYEQIRCETFTSTFSEIADRYRLTPPTIASIFDEYVKELEVKRGAVIAPRVLGIDEKHIVHAMRGVFVDIETGTLLEMVSANKREDIISAIESMIGYDDNIQIVTVDMSPAYRSYVQECLPNAMIIVDKFHLFQLMGSKVTATRTKIIDYLGSQLKQMADTPHKQSMQITLNAANKDHYLFKYGTEKVEDDIQRVNLMARLCQAFPEFNHLRMLKEGFEKIYASFDREAAEKTYQEWLSLVPPAGSRQQEAWQNKYGIDPTLYSDFRTLANTMKNWHKEIFNYFDEGCSYTNAATEGLNNLIERFNRLGNGYSFERLRAKALYYHLAAPSKRYVLKAKRLPVYRPEDAYTFTEYTSTYTFKKTTTSFSTERYIEEEPNSYPPRKPLSVHSYLRRPAQ